MFGTEVFRVSGGRAMRRLTGKKIVMLMLAASLTFMLCMSAGADMAYGDRNENVEELQRLLMETGYLEEAPDGIFGSNTEAAVKSFQANAGLPVTGVADDKTMQFLYDTLADMRGEPQDGGGEDDG